MIALGGNRGEGIGEFFVKALDWDPCSGVCVDVTPLLKEGTLSLRVPPEHFHPHTAGWRHALTAFESRQAPFRASTSIVTDRMVAPA